MVSTLLKSSLREIRQSLGRYLAILAIVGLGVGFFAGLRMSQPSMEATGVAYLDRYDFHDFRLLSTLGFTQEDVDAFAKAEGIGEAWGSVYTEFLWQRAEDEETVLVAHMLTEGINEPELLVGRMPEKGNECLADAETFTAADIGRTIRVSPHNDEDTLDLLVYEEYTVVGVVRSPLYLSFERGTASIGSGSVAAFLLMPEEGFDYEAYYEVYLRLEKGERTYSDAYEEQIDAMKPQLEAVAEERGDLRYETLYADAMEEIRDGEEELADGWEEYRTERSDAEEELADAKQELEDGEQEYADGLADYEQGKIDYADGVKEIRDAEKELADGWIEYEDAKADALQQLADAKQELEDGEKEYADGLAELEDAKDKLKKGKQELSSGNQQMSDAKQQLDSAKQQLDQGNAGYLFPYTAYAFENADTTTYTTVEFTDSTMALRTFRGDNSELLDSITIEKTKDFSDSEISIGIRTAFYKLVEILGLLYMKIDAVVVALRGGHF